MKMTMRYLTCPKKIRLNGYSFSQEIALYKGGLDAAMQAARTIISFLTKRSGKGKVTKNSNEAEYRAIFDNLIGDLLAVLFWPEWPAAGLLLTMICKYMVHLS